MEGDTYSPSPQDSKVKTTSPHSSDPTMSSSPPSGASKQASPVVKRVRNPVHPKIAAAGQRIISSDHQSGQRSMSSGSDRSAISTPPAARATNDSQVSAAPLAGRSPPRASTPAKLNPVPVSESKESSFLRTASIDRTRDSSPGSVSLDEFGSQTCQTSSEGSVMLESDGEVDIEVLSDMDQSSEHEARDNEGLDVTVASSSNDTSFVMPKITLPAGVEFTDQGRKMGYLNILVTGRRRSGKTSFVRHLLDGCRDVIHVDAPRRVHIDPRGRTMEETRASTRPLPVAAGRSSIKTEDHLDRNLSIIDVHSYSDECKHQLEHEPYESILNLLRERSTALQQSEILEQEGLRTSPSAYDHPQIDAVVLIFNPDTPLAYYDWPVLNRIAAMTTLIPVMSYSDTHSQVEIESYRRSIAQAFEKAQLTPVNIDPASSASDPVIIYAVSTAADDTEMDASILMSDTYTRPLVASDLGTLISHLFNPATIERLRHNCLKSLLGDQPFEAPVMSTLPQPPSTMPIARDEQDRTNAPDHKDKQWAIDLRRYMKASSKTQVSWGRRSGAARRNELELSDPFGLMQFVGRVGNPLLMGLGLCSVLTSGILIFRRPGGHIWT